MRFNYRWLQKYIETDATLEDLLDAIMMCGHEVEEFYDLGALSGKIVFGEIKTLAPHPDADKLSLCTVDSGAGDLQIVCGATNIAVGQKVPLAVIGASLPNGLKLKKTKIRGVESQGMMCAMDELGVGDDHEGIWIQPEDSPVGEPFDAVIDIKVTPNRPDALSLVGLARDLAAKTGGKLRLPEVKFSEASDAAADHARVVVEAKDACPRYCARVVRNVQVGPSPVWMQRRLESAGLRPINNVVDVTNYVMLELGHPLHAFDLDTLAKKTIVVRKAREGEKIPLLDETTVALDPDDLLICDAGRPVALAGVMGGGETEITAGTTNVLLESAYFNPASIRRTSKRHDKSTDSSYRFERGADPEKLLNALHRAAQLIAELAGGEVLKGTIDITGKLPAREPIILRHGRLRALSGLAKITGREIADILTKLGFELQRVEEGEFVVTAPSHRPDIEGEADLVEEVARIYGYDKIPVALPVIPSAAVSLEPDRETADRVSDLLRGMGFCQAINLSFATSGANAVAGCPDDRAVVIQNPLVSEQEALRRSLVPSLLENAVTNQNQGVDSVRLFEVGRTYAWREGDPAGPGERDIETGVEEPLFLAALLMGATPADWRGGGRDYDFFDVKGVVEELLDRLGLQRVVIETAEDIGYLHPGRAAAFLKGGRRACWFGELHPAIARELGLRRRAFLLEAPLSGPLVEARETATYRPLPKFPPSKRDIAVVVDRGTPVQDLERTVRSTAQELLAGLRLFDVYEGEHVEAGKKSVAFAMTFRAEDRTLKEDEVNEAFGRIVSALDKKHGAQLRA